ncbi:MAG: tRNA (N6-threonylcarbamoyladenosine(37)-N6)-methyltransferase TrmO [Desulfovibrio sp.]|uniref:tRNA (N6-threonylcarbamoyladenosine(37)-N6)-methyltransferase TrmO n=1 Tax=Desulfovibrio sp. 7SRBS1 TaxID=3378064 RepID=UPI003B3C95A8
MDTTLKIIGHISTQYTDRSQCPKQAEGHGVKAELTIEPEYQDALLGIKEGHKLVLLTWLHASDRSVLQCHPRGEKERPLTGVFYTRSPDRPNPIGLHEVKVVAIPEPGRLVVDPMEVLDGTPLVDIKKVMG